MRPTQNNATKQWFWADLMDFVWSDNIPNPVGFVAEDDFIAETHASFP